MTFEELLSIEIADENGNLTPEGKILLEELDKVIFTKGGWHKGTNEN